MHQHQLLLLLELLLLELLLLLLLELLLELLLLLVTDAANASTPASLIPLYPSSSVSSHQLFRSPCGASESS